MKGDAKEAIGSLVGDKGLESEGKSDRQAGEAEEKVGHAKDRVEDVLENVEHKARDVIDDAKGAARRE